MAEPSHQHVTCQEVVELITDYLEAALPPHETTLFEQHLNFCDGCVIYVEQMRVTLETVGRAGEEHLPEEARAKLLAAFREWKTS
jgi:anti-sigma factor RsiW